MLKHYTSHLLLGLLVGLSLAQSVCAVDPKGYYAILDINSDATQEEIKRAYKRKARDWHPDKHLNEKEKYEIKFKQLVEAHDTLSNPVSRRIYDETGELPKRDDIILGSFEELHEKGIWINNEGKTLLYELCQRRLNAFLEKISAPYEEYLLKKTINLLCPDETVLMYLVEQNNLEFVGIMIQLGCVDPYQKNLQGKTAVDMLLAKYRTETQPQEEFVQLINQLAERGDMPSAYYDDPLVWNNLTFKNKYFTPKVKSILFWTVVSGYCVGVIIRSKNKKHNRKSTILEK